MRTLGFITGVLVVSILTTSARTAKVNELMRESGFF
jgi:hypothetical protein